MTSLTCPHGQLARSCELCEKDAEIAALKIERSNWKERAKESLVKYEAATIMSGKHKEWWVAVIGERDKAIAERDAYKAMLDRIAKTAADYFHPPAEECVADGVDAMADKIAELEKELGR